MVREFSGASVECSATGKIADANVPNKPASSKFDPMNASSSRRVASPEISVIAAGRLVHTGATRDMGGDIDAFEERLIGMLTQSQRIEPLGSYFRAE